MMFLGRPEPLRRFVLGIVLGTLLWSGLLPAASAQQTHTLHIQDGTVYVNGQPLSEDQLPDSLNLEGIRAHYRFLGIRRPVIELNGRLFAVGDGLTPVTEEEVRKRRASVILGGRSTRAPQSVRDGSVREGAVSGKSGRGMHSRDAEAGHQQYLNAIERSSHKLYERLLRERRMEQSARNLARAIRLLPKGPERRAKIDTLRAMLEDIFELKQENRRREVGRLERQIRELQRTLRRRAQMRDRMIEHRLRQLVDSTRGR